MVTVASPTQLTLDFDSIPYGYCHCGCGERTRIAERNHSCVGQIKGEPLRYIPGHNRREIIPQYVEQDMGYTSLCWVWTGRHNNHGYGMMSMGTGYARLAHRVMYEATYGPIPQGVEPDHLCEIPPCIRPDHLDLVTHAVNIRRSKRAKITIEQARRIRAGTPRTDALFAVEYGLSPLYVARVRLGFRWQEGKE